MGDTGIEPRHTALKPGDFLFLPFGCLLTLSPYVLFGGLLVLAAVGVYIYYNVNVDLFGMGRPDYSSLVIDKRFQNIESGDKKWIIQYEKQKPTVFTGKIRHASPIRLEMVPFLTHDILVTSGDYADPLKVSTSVADHHFFWASRVQEKPVGSINLLHTVPLNEAIYQQLLEIRSDQMVTITGTEVLKIEAFDQKGKPIGGWQDTGCNSLVVTSVTIQKR